MVNGVEVRRDSTPKRARSRRYSREPWWLRGLGGGSTHTEPVPPATPRRRGGRFDTGFDEPQPWAWDGGKRREAVLDTDCSAHCPSRRLAGLHKMRRTILV